MPEILTSLAILTVWLALVISVAGLGVYHYRRFREHYKTGLYIGLMCVLMVVPLTVLSFSVSSVSGPMRQPPGAAPFFRVFFALGIVMVIIFATAIYAIKAAWYMILYHVAASEWISLEPDAFPLLRRTGRIPARVLIGALGFGAAAGLLSAAAFQILGVRASEPLRKLMAMFPGVESLSVFIKLPVMLAAVSAMAVTEELLFRGAMFGFLLRVLGRGCAGLAASSIMVSLVWASLHLQNTDAPVVKLVQIFVIGLVLCALARKGRIEVAIAAHVGLNAAAATAAVLVG